MDGTKEEHPGRWSQSVPWNRAAAGIHYTSPESKPKFCPLRSSGRQTLQPSAASRTESLTCHYKSVGNKQFFEPGAEVTKPADWSMRGERKQVVAHQGPPPTSGTSACARKITQRVSIVVRLSDKSTVCVMTALQRWISSCSTPWDQTKAMQTPPGLIIIACARVRSCSWFVQARMTVFMASRGHTLFIACTV